MNHCTITLLTALLLASLAALRAAEPAHITVEADKPGHAVPATLYGIFFEEINHAGEGGFYAGMVLNRDFEMTTLLKGAKWAGNLLRTAADWQERKWFGNELTIRQETDYPSSGKPQMQAIPQNPANFTRRLVARNAGPRILNINCCNDDSYCDSISKNNYANAYRPTHALP